MCGISGIIGENASADILNKMVSSLTHRGPDSQGTYISPSGGCVLGHNRLKIIDLSDAGKQPMRDADGGLLLTFNGEIYNYLELKEKIGAYPYRSESDSEVILAAYHKWGESCVDHMVGMFAFVIWNEEKQSAFCARDRLGIKPFHYSLQGDTLYFASEIKAILAAGIEAKANRKTWATYLRHGIYDHSEDSFFEGIKSLPAGHTMHFQNAKVQIRRYWDLGAIAQNKLDLPEEEIIAQFQALLKDAVKLRLRSDVPLGVNLSGGLDSSSLLALVDSQSEQTEALNSFTFGFENPLYNEINFAAQVPTQKEWLRHTELIEEERLWSAMDDLMYHQEAPFGGFGTLSYYMMHRLIKEKGVTVVLEGQGADELLGGYAYYQLEPSAQPVYNDGSSFLKTECLSDTVNAIVPKAPVFDTPFETRLDNMLYADLLHTKVPRVLRMNDRLSMAYGLELREPFLDHRIVEFCFQLPESYKIRDGQSKYLMRAAMGDLLPNSVRFAEKRAVVTPQREWIRETFKDRIQAVIDSPEFAARNIFDMDQVKAQFKNFCDGKGDNAFFIWQWLNLDSWFRTFNVKGGL